MWGLDIAGPGDKVIYATHPNRPLGTISMIDYASDSVTVMWDDSSLMPRYQDFPMACLSNGTLVLQQQQLGLPVGSVKCECGTSIALGCQDHPDFHSFWCPIKPK